MDHYIAEVVRTHSSRINDYSIYFAPDIKKKKMRKAIKSYAQGVEPEDILMLIDNTVFGSAKKGLLLTSESLYGYSMFSDPKKIDLREIETVIFDPLDLSALKVNGKDFFQPTGPQEKSMLLVAEMLRDACGLMDPVDVDSSGECAVPAAPPEKDPVEMLKDLKDLHDSGILSDAEYEEKRQPYLDQL